MCSDPIAMEILIDNLKKFTVTVYVQFQVHKKAKILPRKCQKLAKIHEKKMYIEQDMPVLYQKPEDLVCIQEIPRYIRESWNRCSVMQLSFYYITKCGMDPGLIKHML